MNTTPETTPQSNLPAWFETFAELRTIPAGWDLSNVLPAGDSGNAGVVGENMQV